MTLIEFLGRPERLCEDMPGLVVQLNHQVATLHGRATTAEARATEAERRVEAMREALEKCQKHFKPLSKDRPPITPDDPEWSAMVRADCEEFAREYEELDKAIDAALAQPQEQSDAS
jgi:protein subunit release factor A